MKEQGTRSCCLVAVAVLAGCGLGISSAAGADKKGAPRPLPPEVLKGWRDAGAEVGWMKDQPPQARAYKFWSPWREEGEAGAIPAFRFPEGLKGELAKLPDPGTAFGLDFHCGFAVNVSMKELARLKNLRSLNLGAGHFTAAKLKELVKLKDLQGLYLFYTNIGDGDLEGLAGLKNLQTLDLSHTRVTDDGLKELAQLKSLRWLNLAETDVTRTGIAALKKDLPGCKIVTAKLAKGSRHDDP